MIQLHFKMDCLKRARFALPLPRTYIIPLLIVIWYLAYWINCEFSQMASYVRKEGYFRGSELFHNITATTETSCLIECEKLPFCQSLNVIKIARTSNDPLHTCQLFNCSISFANSALVEAENTTFYSLKTSQKGTDCKALRIDGLRSSGVYTLKPYKDCSEVQVYCDMTTSGGGWTLLQRRFDGSVSFERTWEEYKHGFGRLDGEFWLGLEKAYQFTKTARFRLRFDMWNGAIHRYMVYYGATISNEANRYKLNWYGGASGNAGDSMKDRNKNQPFSTKDKDLGCASSYRGGWWFGGCFQAHLNGVYGDNRRDYGILWKSFSGPSTSLSKTEIKFKHDY